MAFKRYSSLLIGSVLVGSLALAQPAMAEEAVADTPQCIKTVTETIQIAKAGTVKNPFFLGVSSATVAGIPGAKMVNGSAKNIAFTVPEDTAAGEYTVTFTGTFDLTKTAKLTVTTESKTVEKQEEFNCATVTVDDVTVTAGETKTVNAIVQDGASELKIADNAVEGLKATVQGKTITIDATDAEVKTYTVPFTYKAEGTTDEQKGSFKVTVEKKDEAPAPVVQKIDDVTVTEGQTKTVEVKAAEGATDLKVTAPEGLGVELKAGKLTVNATKSEAKEYTVNFTYKVNGEEKTGTFKVTVEKKAEEPKENASSEFVGSFKGLSSK